MYFLWVYPQKSLLIDLEVDKVLFIKVREESDSCKNLLRIWNDGKNETLVCRHVKKILYLDSTNIDFVNVIQVIHLEN